MFEELLLALSRAIEAADQGKIAELIDEVKAYTEQNLQLLQNYSQLDIQGVPLLDCIEQLKSFRVTCELGTSIASALTRIELATPGTYNGRRPLLYIACGYGQLDYVKFALRNNPDLLQHAYTSVDGSITPFVYAALWGQLDVAKYIANTFHSDTDSYAMEYKAAVVRATKSNQVAVVEWLYGQYHDSINVLAEGESPFILAVERGFFELAQFYYRIGNSCIQQVDKGGHHPLAIAAYMGHTAVVEWLLEIAPALLDKPIPSGLTVSQLTMMAGHFEVMKLVAMFCPENLNQPDATRGMTAIHSAAANGYLDCLKWLVENNLADYKLAGKGGGAPLLVAAFSGQKEIVEYLVGVYADEITEIPLDKFTLDNPSSAADATQNRLACTDLILINYLQQGGNIEKNLQIFRESKEPKIIKTLQLHRAIKFRRLDEVESLLKEDLCYFPFTDQRGNTLLHRLIELHKVNSDNLPLAKKILGYLKCLVTEIHLNPHVKNNEQQSAVDIVRDSDLKNILLSPAEILLNAELCQAKAVIERIATCRFTYRDFAAVANANQEYLVSGALLNNLLAEEIQWLLTYAQQDRICLEKNTIVWLQQIHEKFRILLSEPVFELMMPHMLASLDEDNLKVTVANFQMINVLIYSAQLSQPSRVTQTPVVHKKGNIHKIKLTDEFLQLYGKQMLPPAQNNYPEKEPVSSNASSPGPSASPSGFFASTG